MPQYVSGIDIGRMAIRAVVLKKTAGEWQLFEQGNVERFYGSSGEKTLVQELAELVTKVPLRGPVYVTDSTMNIMVRFISSVPLPPDRLRRLVRLDLGQHVDDGGDLSADMYTVPIAGDDIISCCPLAQPKQVNEVLYALKQNKIVPQAVSIPSAAIFNIARKELAEQEGFNLIIDIGAENTRLIVTRGDDFIACRSIPIGGKQFSLALAEKQNRDFKDAEKLKVSGLASKANAPSLSKPFKDDAPTKATEMPSFGDDDGSASTDADDKLNLDSDILFDGDQGQPEPELNGADADADAEQDDSGLNFSPFESSDQFNVVSKNPPNLSEDELDLDEQLPKPGMQTMQIGSQQLGEDLVHVAEQLHMQISSSMKWFKSQVHMSNLEISNYFLCGGSARLNGLRLYLQHRLGKEVNLFTPHADYTDDERDTIDYTTAIGTALQGDEDALAFDLRPESLLLKESWRKEIIWPRLAAGFLLVAGILFAISLHLDQEADIAAAKVYKDHEQTRKNQLAQLEGLRSERDALYEDLRGIAGRIYAGRDLLNAIRGFKAKAPQDLWIISLATQDIIEEGAKEGARSDTAIDRGSVVVSGRVMPDEKKEIFELQDQFNKWYKDMVAFEDAPKKILFVDSNINKMDVDHENDRAYVFEVRYDFNPTELDDVASLMKKKGVNDAP